MIDDYQIVTKKEEPKDVEFRYKQEDTLIEIIRVIINFIRTLMTNEIYFLVSVLDSKVLVQEHA